ncbi:MAG: RidA family protein [Methylocystis sp.]|nr:RidA family protein [Methylocystis sp.]MCA3583122.1 RidA family protein [Methylocystis sp.]MCA3593271.1 RidA family protein [Methylocystis sp.]
MARKLISTGSPFERDYGYSRAVVDGGVVYISGTTGYDYEKMTLPHDVGEQTRNIFRTVEKVLNEAGSSMANILRCQYFVIDHTYCEPVLKVCGEVLRDIRPAGGIYVVTALLKPEMKVEIEVTAKLA